MYIVLLEFKMLFIWVGTGRSVIEQLLARVWDLIPKNQWILSIARYLCGYFLIYQQLLITSYRDEIHGFTSCWFRLATSGCQYVLCKRTMSYVKKNALQKLRKKKHYALGSRSSSHGFDIIWRVYLQKWITLLFLFLIFENLVFYIIMFFLCCIVLVRCIILVIFT